MSLLIDNELQTAEAILHTLSHSKAIAEDDFKGFYDQARRMAPPEYSTIIISDLTGKQLLNTRLPYGASLPVSKSNLMKLRTQYGPDKTIVSDIFFAPVGKRYDFAIQVPVLRDNVLRYYLQMGISAERMHPLLVRANLHSEWVNVLTDRNGIVLARSINADKHVGKPVREALRKRILAGEQAGMHYGVTLDGVPTAAFFSRVPISEWTVIVNLPLAEMRQPAIQAALLLGGLILVLLGLSVAAARWYAKKTSGPVERLRKAAESLGRGEAIAAMPSGILEIDAVSHSLVDASNEIRRSREDLERRVKEAVASAERAQRALLQSQKMEALGRLTAGIAHDFNNILQTLSAALQLIRLSPDHSRIQSLAETCDKAVNRATTLTAQMRSFGKVQDATLETIKPKNAIETAFPLLKNALPSNVDLTVQCDETIWPVTVDPLQFELSLLNIVINARDAMAQQGGSVNIALFNVVADEGHETLKAGEYVRIVIRDNGIGMTPDILSKALEPFFTTKGIEEGSGLGLPQAYGFAEQSGGKLVLALLGGPCLGSELKGPALEDVHLDKVKEDKVDERDTDDGNTPDPANGLLDNNTVDADQHGEDLSTHDGDEEDGRRHVLPEVSRQTGREDDEVRCGRDVQVHDGLKLFTRDMEDITRDKEGGERKCRQHGTQDNRQEDQLADSPLVWVCRNLGIVDGNNQRGGVVENTDQNQQNGFHSPLKRHGDAEEEHQKVNGRRDTVECIRTHALEDGA